ncbi:MAG: hypothetical protein HXY34_06740 [Candidatus Thorarchaeota archaeon]|nr:hypothetical protein [Candidatus Thorarchaeota archaeon]
MPVQNPLTPLLRLALQTAKTQYESYIDAMSKIENGELRSLYQRLAESEAAIVAKIQHMMITGVLDEIEELESWKDELFTPDLNFSNRGREEADSRADICDRVLQRSISSCSLYMQMASRANSELLSRVCKYLAYLKMWQIAELMSMRQSLGLA